jgi:ABC-2 type transport system permease protein
MRALLRAELINLRTTRTFAVLVGTAVVASLLLVSLTASLGSDFTEAEARAVFTGDLSSIFILLLGAIGATGEWRHRTIAGSVLAAPDRLRLLAAKTLAYATAGVVLSLAVTTAIMVVGTLILSNGGEPTLDLGQLADVLWRNLALAALLGALGVGIGALLRNQVVTVTGLLVFGLMIEPAVLQNVPEVGRFGPIVGAPSGILRGEDWNGLLAAGPALAVSLAWAGAAFAAAAALLRRRDLV